MSHELRTPLNAINGFSEMMVGEMFGPLGDDRYKTYAQDILNSGQHLLALINDVLDMSKIEAGKLNLRFEPVRLDELAEDTVRLIKNRAETAGLDGRHRRAGPAGRGRRLSRAQAGAAEPALQRREVHAARRAHRAEGRRLARQHGRAGEGQRGRHRHRHRRRRISSASPGRSSRSRASTPRPSRARGLGLALSKSLIEMHGGMLEIASQPGLGTTVSFLLPVRQSRFFEDSRGIEAA